MGTTWSLDPAYQDLIIEEFKRLGALLTDDHFVYTKGKHGSVYVAKDLVYPATESFSSMAEEIAGQFADKQIDTVVGIAPIANTLAYEVAAAIQGITNRPCFPIAAEKKPVVVKDPECGDLYHGDRITIRPSFQRFIDGQQVVLCVEDIINTGGSLQELIDVVHDLGANEIWAADLWNRGGKTAKDFDIRGLFSLCDRKYEAYEPADCPMCATGMPQNKEFGHSGK